jgi:hypothetical protein
MSLAVMCSLANVEVGEGRPSTRGRKRQDGQPARQSTWHEEDEQSGDRAEFDLRDEDRAIDA